VSLNIKNEEACRLITQLAHATGETMTTAVVTAVRERLDRVRQPQRGALAERLLAIGRECAERMGPEYRAIARDHGALLYDERGLPK
jgi:antitoxin VapB